MTSRTVCLYVLYMASTGLAMMVPQRTPIPTSQPSSAPYVLPLNRETIPVRRNGQVVSYKTSYSGTISIGRPSPQEFRVVFDTGSGHVILPSVECKSPSCLVHRRYNMSASDTAIPINADGSLVAEGQLSDQVTIGFGTGQVTGEFVHDEVCIGPAKPVNGSEKSELTSPCDRVHVVMAVEMSKHPFKNFGFDGILGLGLHSLALSRNFSFFDHLANSNQMWSPHFGVYLTDGEDGDVPEIAFGGHNPKKLLGSLAWAAVHEPDLGYWQLRILAVRVDGVELDCCKDGSCRGVMDTGTSHLGIPNPHDKTLGQLLQQDAGDVEDCQTIKGPILEFQFDGFTMTLHPEDYMRKLPLLEGLQVGSEKGVTLDQQTEAPAVTKISVQPKSEPDPNGKKHCRPRLMPVNLPPPLGPNLFILGEPVLHRYYTVFDWMGPHIGFGFAMKSRYNDAEKRKDLRADVKALLGSANSAEVSSDESHVFLLQVTYSLHLRKA